MAEMAGKATDCARFREQMLDAASASLSGDLLAAFDAHLRDCAACGGEFRRVQILVQKIDQALSVSLTAEPSAQLVANVRKNILQDVSAQPHGAAAWRRWSAWATAAGVCAAFALLLFVAHTSRKFNPPIHDSAAVHTSSSSASKLNAHPRLNADTEVAVTQPRKPALGFARRASLRRVHKKAAEPEIIIDSSQTQAILLFAAAIKRPEVKSAKLQDEKTIETLQIELINIPPLNITALNHESNSPFSDMNHDGDNNSKGASR